MKSLVVFACLAVAALVAEAQTPHYVDLFFSRNIADPTAPPTDASPIVLTPGTDTWLSLYARTPGKWQQFTTTYKVGPSTKTWAYTNWVGDMWNSIAVDFVDSSGMLERADSYCTNPETPYGLLRSRWFAESNFGWDSDGGTGFFVASAAQVGRGCGWPALDAPGSANNVAVFDSQQVPTVTPDQLSVPGYVYTMLGYAHIVTPSSLNAPADLFFKVGRGTFARWDATPNYDYVRFGSSTPVLGKTIGATGNQPMVHVIPEPAALALLAFAGLAVRRR